MNEEERKEKLDGDPLGDEIAAGPDDTTTAVEPEDTETDWKAEAEKNHNLYLRSQADMENMRKRLEREKADFLKFANERLIKELLPVLDNLERAMAHAPGDGNGEGEVLAEGVRLIYEGLLGSLERFGVGPVVAAGEPFDPNFHEAVMQRDDPDTENNTVLEVVQKGYLLNDRLIRPAMVIVSRRPTDEGRDGD